jgi:short-subunit dehydrogenase
MARRALAGLRILVTGASQGIGRAIAVEAARRGGRVVASARSADLLQELRKEVQSTGGEIEVVAGDICKPEDRAALVAAAQQYYGGLDILINNAGIGATGHFVDSDPAALRSIFETNFFALCEVTRVFLPMLKAGRTPMLINISSVLGRRAIPGRPLYSASKFAVAGFSESLRAELWKDGIDVLVVNPGLTQTNFSKNMLEQKAKVQLDHLRGMTSEEVAVATLDAAAKGKPEITLTRQGRLLVGLSRFAPSLVDFFARRKVKKIFNDEIAARRSAAAAGVK